MKKMKTGASIIYKKTKGEKAVYTVIFILFLCYALTLIYPFFYLFINSFQTDLGYLTLLAGDNPFAFPEKWNFSNYALAFSGMNMVSSMGRKILLPEMFFNSIWYTIGVVGLGVFASCLTGYCLAKYKFRGSNVLYAIAIFTMTIPIVGSTGSAFMIMSALGIYNTPWYVLLTGFAGFGFNFLVMYGFFKNLSWSYAEAVFIDGGGHFTVFFRIMLPQARPLILTLIIMAFIGAWNDYTTVLLFLPDYPTVASGMYRIQLSFTRAGDMPAYFAGLIMTTIPIVILFAAFSNVIMNNMTVGGIKG